MAPLITIGAVILLWRKAATKVIVSHAPSGTVPITRTPRGARPLSRTMLVLTAVSSINTSRAGSSMPCSRIQRRRARATSARSRSAACRLFFEGDAMSPKKPRKSAPAGSDPPLQQSHQRLLQGQIGLLSDEPQYCRRMFFQRRDASSARLRRGAPSLVPALQPFDPRTRTDAETLRSLTPRRPLLLDGFNHALPQVTGIGPWHRPPPQRRMSAKKLALPYPHGNPADSNPGGTSL